MAAKEIVIFYNDADFSVVDDYCRPTLIKLIVEYLAYFQTNEMIFILICIVVSEVSMADGSSNQAVVATSDVNIACTTNANKRVSWQHDSSSFTHNTKSKFRFYNGFNIITDTDLKSRYSVIQINSTSHVLVINATQASDAGRYSCFESGMKEEREDAELIILSYDPVCSLNHPKGESSYFELSCSVRYSGNWAPVMAWQQDEGAVITPGVVNNTVPYKSVTYSLTVAATRNLTASKYTCTTYFTEANRPANTIAANVPTYKHVWSITWPMSDTLRIGAQTDTLLDALHTPSSLVAGCLSATIVFIFIICTACIIRLVREKNVDIAATGDELLYSDAVTIARGSPSTLGATPIYDEIPLTIYTDNTMTIYDEILLEPASTRDSHASTQSHHPLNVLTYVNVETRNRPTMDANNGVEIPLDNIVHGYIDVLPENEFPPVTEAHSRPTTVPEASTNEYEHLRDCYHYARLELKADISMST